MPIGLRCAPLKGTGRREGAPSNVPASSAPGLRPRQIVIGKRGQYERPQLRIVALQPGKKSRTRCRTTPASRAGMLRWLVTSTTSAARVTMHYALNTAFTDGFNYS